jgi:SAM-dependent methyltransferase
VPFHRPLSLPKRLVLQALDVAGVAPAVLDMRDSAQYLLDRETRQRNARFHAPDGLPIPPARLIHKVVGRFDSELFYDGGVARFAYIRDVLGQGGVNVEDLHAVLDWGCGCCRVLRQWRQLDNVQIYGSDYNEQLVAWCRSALPFARLATNGLAPPLAFPDDTFDLVYGISVFTHLDESLQIPWIDELRRVVKPGGHILITVSGPVGGGKLLDEEIARYEAGQLVVTGAAFQGQNYCEVIHPDAYVREVLARGLEVVAAVPARIPGTGFSLEFDDGQDAYLLRVPAN